MEDKLNYFISRTDQHLDRIWVKLSEIEEKLDSKHDALNEKVTELDRFKSRVIGMAIAISLLANGAWAVFSKIL